jgi:hypothetical protein
MSASRRLQLLRRDFDPPHQQFSDLVTARPTTASSRQAAEQRQNLGTTTKLNRHLVVAAFARTWAFAVSSKPAFSILRCCLPITEVAYS